LLFLDISNPILPQNHPKIHFTIEGKIFFIPKSCARHTPSAGPLGAVLGGIANRAGRNFF